MVVRDKILTLCFSLAPVWYEYKRAPCVQMAYPEPGNMRTVKEIGDVGNKAMCADSRFAVAGTTVSLYVP